MNDAISQIANSMQDCTRCPLYKNRINVVPGEGNPKAQVVFIGEAPGQQENKQGRPFVGRAGKYLDELLLSIGWQRSDIFITNIVKDQPPGNRDPLPEEKKICTDLYLTKQIEAIKPKVIVTLGRHASAYFLPDIGGISQIHGRVYRRKNGIIYFPLYHPAAALYNSQMKKTLEADFNKLPKIIKLINEQQK